MISIIILNWNKPKLTLRCLKSLSDTGALDQCEVVLVDNGSSASNKRFLWREARKFNVVKVDLTVNRYFGEGNNIGAEAASGEILAFLNNDVEVQAGWLEPLVEKLMSSGRVGAVGPKFIYPDGTIQEIGALVNSSGKPLQLGKGMPNSETQFSKSRQVDYVSAACLLMRKQDFLAVGGFHYAFEPAYYEDTELCHQLSLRGKEIWCVPNSVVVHLERQTTADPALGQGFSSFAEVNRTKFMQRLHERQRYQRVSRKTRAVGGRGRVAVLVGDNLQLGADTMKALCAAGLLQSHGFDVAILGSERYSKLRLNQLCLDLNVPPVNQAVETHHWAATQPSFDFTISSDDKINGEWTGLAARNLSLGSLTLANISKPGGVGGSLIDNQILAVGRFQSGTSGGNHDLLIRAFKSLIDSGYQATLNIVGALHPDKRDLNYYKRCVGLAARYPVNFFPNASQMLLSELHRRSGIYWSARGFGADWDAMEKHTMLGSGSLAQAMSVGTICIAFGPPAPDDMIQFGLNGFRFLSEQSLVRRTLLAWQLPSRELKNMRRAAAQSAIAFSEREFERKLLSLIADLPS